MQPYFLPYIGYWQLIKAVDTFVIYDNIKYTKKGWINRNRYLKNNGSDYFTIPLKLGSDHLDIRERVISESFNRIKILNQINMVYKNAPFFSEIFFLFEKIINNKNDNLFEFIYHSIHIICSFLEIKTKMIISSSIPINHDLKSEEKVLEICKYLNTDIYINSIGGQKLYSRERFIQNGITLKFLQTTEIKYSQFNNEFLPQLSILDVMMFNSKNVINNLLMNYELI